MFRWLFAVLSLSLSPAVSYADAVAFVGLSSATDGRPHVGAAVGRHRGAVGFEVEYAGSQGEATLTRPALSTVTVNAVVRLPEQNRRVALYATGGVGIYGESLGEGRGSTNGVIGLGGGVLVPLAGVLRLRLDYRLFLLRSSGDERPSNSHSHRGYAGLSISF